MQVEPITCLRPQSEFAQEFCALPYDVYDRSTALAYIAEHPRSFLAIDRPDCAFEEGHDPTAPEVYLKAQEIMRDRQRDRTLTIDETPCLYLVEQTDATHTQTGVMCAISVDDYLSGKLRRHELTLHDKELDRVNHIKATRAQTGPVFCCYRDSLAIDTIVMAAKMAEPLYDFVSADGVRQRVWRVSRPAAIEALTLAFAGVEEAYIADGHHRAAAAVSIACERREAGKESDPSDHFLCVLFPAGQLRIEPYDRIVADTCGMDAEELVRRIGERGFTVSEPSTEAPKEFAKGTFAMYSHGAWRILSPDSPTDDLDVTVLQERLLSPVLGIDNPRSDKRISFVGGIGPQELQDLTPKDGVSFALFPTSIEELMEISDRGDIMPPKSTWFSPKLLSGIALRRIW